ncbi:MAG: pyridoxamine 5'-phosphate oxidase family protein [Anaerolineales bacterium]|nr:pyridoxamine 5'-phosphate oxidase family protein [Anaerolineales bacterium]
MEYLYQERVQSRITSWLFLVLMLIFFALFAWRFSALGFRVYPVVCLFFALFFLFYLINYRVLRIIISEDAVLLKFGFVRWKTLLANIQAINLDDSPAWIKYGGAGVHFAFVNRRYRAFYNFLEHPRVLITFHHKQGLVQELVFTTRHPQEVIQIIQSRLKK